MYHRNLLQTFLALTTISCLFTTGISPLHAEQPAAPTGQVKGPFTWHSEIFPGTERNYWIYVPAQYNPQQAACVLVVQDGLHRAQQWGLIEAMDELIESQDMPVTIGIFVDPGVVPAPKEDAQPRFNRSFEYDALGDRYARFLLEEILPAVGEHYHLSDDPNDRAIAGASSGGICAFTVAWERPDEFRRVLSTIGTYVGLRGGDIYPTLIRKMEPKPIRVFLQDGRNDLNIFAGDWFVANESMLSALKFSNYDVKHAWGNGGHDPKHSREIMHDALRWIWRGYPEPIVANDDDSNRRIRILLPDRPWELVSEGHQFTEGPAFNERGEFFFSDVPRGKIYKVDTDGKRSEFAADSPGANGLMFAPDGRLVACQNGNQQLVTYDDSGVESVLLADAPANDLVVLPHGVYYTDPAHQKVWFVDKTGKRHLIDDQLRFPNGIIASADQSQLFVADTQSRFITAYQIQDDGLVKYRQPYGYLHLENAHADSGADGMTIDSEGRLYVTSRLGLQVLDQPGRVHLIIAKPQAAWLSNVTFGGPNQDYLYVTCGDKVYRRQVASRGMAPPHAAVKPPKPRL